MLIGVCELCIYLPDCRSLKDKRSIISNLKSQLRKKFNISISEINHKNLWKKSTLGICCISDNRQIIDKTMDSLIKKISSNPKVELINFKVSTI
ncbi:MAG TPA: DUF503 domain-containing protein [Candidatus Atribacteria bacterium]|jgi:uncharacterized protein YlxP (DUF503 family)|nr:DUF503 domain-containing protein [Candidatus Atribacteria bacterium]